MVFKLSQKDFELIDAVLDDYAKKGKTDKICPYCGTPIKKKVVGMGYTVSCQTQNCLQETCRGI
ncbi:MAG: hypothetical protein MJ196_01600 [Treponemataceae bacterium]|nr:hypothetical protein [Treponemataceae bacterium]